MCTLYSVTTNQQATRQLTLALEDTTGNLPPLPAIFPDSLAPVVFNAADGKRSLGMFRWGMPGPPHFGGAPIMNVRNTNSPHWRRWLNPASRCLVPATSFCEYEDTKPRKTPTWFALDESRPLFFFAGIWTPWYGARGTKAAPVVGDHKLFGFLTTDANAEVAPIHPKAMPVILTEPDELQIWMNAPWSDAKAIQRPLPDGVLKIVASGQKQDGGDTEPVQKASKLLL
jgi:putative SOS response-associated peptidase YedK